MGGYLVPLCCERTVRVSHLLRDPSCVQASDAGLPALEQACVNQISVLLLNPRCECVHTWVVCGDAGWHPLCSPFVKLNAPRRVGPTALLGTSTYVCILCHVTCVSLRFTLTVASACRPILPRVTAVLLDRAGMLKALKPRDALATAAAVAALVTHFPFAASALAARVLPLLPSPVDALAATWSDSDRELASSMLAGVASLLLRSSCPLPHACSAHTYLHVLCSGGVGVW